jgi:hypothetical protein
MWKSAVHVECVKFRNINQAVNCYLTAISDKQLFYMDEGTLWSPKLQQLFEMQVIWW